MLRASPHLGMFVGGQEKLFLPAMKPDSKASKVSGSSVPQQRRPLRLVTLQEHTKGHILPPPLPYHPITPFRMGWEKWLHGEDESWGPRKKEIDFARHCQHAKPNPGEALPAKTLTQAHEHKHHRGVPAQPSGGSATLAFSPNMCVPKSPDPSWEWEAESGKAGQSDTQTLPEMKQPRCEARGQVAPHERKVAAFVCLENTEGEGWHTQDTCFSSLFIKTKSSTPQMIGEMWAFRHLMAITNSSHGLPKSHSFQNTPGDIKASEVRFYEGSEKEGKSIAPLHFSVSQTLFHGIHGVP